MEQTVREIIARIAECSADFSADANLREELDVDSYRAAELAFELERVLKVKLPEERYAAAQTLNDILSLLSSIAA